MQVLRQIYCNLLKSHSPNGAHSNSPRVYGKNAIYLLCAFLMARK